MDGSGVAFTLEPGSESSFKESVRDHLGFEAGDSIAAPNPEDTYILLLSSAISGPAMQSFPGSYLHDW